MLVFLEDMAVLGRAVGAVCARRDPQFRRINLEIQGNTDAFLHAHVTPRYEWEPADVIGWPPAVHHVRGPVTPAPAWGGEFDDLVTELGAEIDGQQRLRRARPVP